MKQDRKGIIQASVNYFSEHLGKPNNQLNKFSAIRSTL